MRTCLTEKQLLSNQTIIYCNTDFKVIQLNKTAVKFFSQFSNTERFNLKTQFNFEVVNITPELLLDILSQKKNWNGLVSFSFDRKKAEYFIANISLELVKNKYNYIIQIKTDKSNTKKDSEIDLLFNNHFKKILNASNEGYALMNKDYIIVSINKRAQSITQITHGQNMQIGHSMFEYLPIEAHQYCIGITEKVLAGEKVRLTNEYPGLNGKKTFLCTDYLPAYDNEGNITGVIIHTVDISEQHYSRLQLEEAALLMQSILRATSEALAMISLDYKVLLYNERMNFFLKTIFKIPKGVKIGADFFDYILPERKELVKQVFEKTVGGEKIEIQNQFNSKWMLASYTPVNDKNGKVIAVCISIRDITEIKNKQLQLEQSEMMYSTALNNLAESVVLLDKNFKILQINLEAERLFEIDRNSLDFLITFSLLKLGFKADNNQDNYILNQINWKDIIGQKRDVVLYKITNNIRSVFLVNIAVIDNSTNGKSYKQYVISLRDITKVEMMSERINQLSMIAMKVPNGIIIADKDGYIQWVNTGFTNMFGYEYDEVLGKVPAVILEGKETDTSVSALIQKKIKKRISFSAEILNYHKNGNKVWIKLSKQPIFDNKGNFIQYYSLLTDITPEKNLVTQLEEERKENHNNITRAVYKAYEEERTFLSKELHDSVNQKLTASIFNLTRYSTSNKPDPELLKNSLVLLQDSMKEIRSLSKKLVATEFLNIGFEDAISQIIYTSTESFKKLKFKVKVSTNAEALIPDDLKVNIFRILQEQIQNITKHANATSVLIVIEILENTLLSFITSDNGKGYDPKKKKPGVGILNIMNRVESFNGNCTIVSAPKEGCSYKITFPLK